MVTVKSGGRTSKNIPQGIICAFLVVIVLTTIASGDWKSAVIFSVLTVMVIRFWIITYYESIALDKNFLHFSKRTFWNQTLNSTIDLNHIISAKVSRNRFRGDWGEYYTVSLTEEINVDEPKLYNTKPITLRLNNFTNESIQRLLDRIRANNPKILWKL